MKLQDCLDDLFALAEEVPVHEEDQLSVGTVAKMRYVLGRFTESLAEGYSQFFGKCQESVMAEVLDGKSLSDRARRTLKCFRTILEVEEDQIDQWLQCTKGRAGYSDRTLLVLRWLIHCLEN